MQCFGCIFCIFLCMWQKSSTFAALWYRNDVVGMKKRFVIFVLLSVCLSGRALETDYRVSFRAGGIMPDGKVDVMLGAKGKWVAPSLGAELAVAFHPEWSALRDWNNASAGVAIGYWYLGDNQWLGSAITPYFFMDIPLVRLPHFVLGLRPGVGAAFVTKTYRNTVSDANRFQALTDANRCIGSVFNFHFPEALYLEFPIRDGWSIPLSVGWYHISNGSMVQPNSGYNMFAGDIGVRFTPQPDTPRREVERTEVKKHWEVELAFAGGGRQVYYRDKQTFFACAMQVSAYWRAHQIFRLGGGVDVFYDGAYLPRETYFGKTNLSAARANGADCWRLGVSVQPEFMVGAFSVGFHFGVYLLDGVKNLEPADEAQTSETGRLDKGVFYRYDLLNAGSAGYPDGWLYTQIVLRYRLPWHLFLQASMKAHLTKVEFVSAGIGVWL